MKNKRTLKVTALCTCIALLTCMLSTTVYADSKDTKESKEISGISASDICKDETVYVISDADGSVNKIIVNDWMKGEDAASTDEYYEREMSKKLPVDMTVSYTLDGQKIKAEDLAGKSGKVTIRFDFKNNETMTANVGGKKVNMYVPFTAISCMLFDNDNFTNIEVTNGKIVNDGQRTVVAGFAMPGMNENLKLTEAKDLPDYVEITADTTSFELDGTYTAVTCELFNDMDLSDVDNVDDLDGMMNQVTEAMDSLLNGTDELYQGLSTLEEKSAQLFAGIDKLQAGATTLSEGGKALSTGMDQAQAGATQLSQGLVTIDSNSAALNQGAKQVFDSLLATANTQLAAAGMQGVTLTQENYAKTLEGVLSNLPQGSEAYVAVATLKGQLDAYNQFYAGLLQYTGGVSQSAAGASELAKVLPQLQAGAVQLSDGATALGEGMTQVKEGGDALQSGITQLKDGSLKLSQGVSEFADKGIGKLTESFGGNISELVDRAKATVDAAKSYKNYSGLENEMEGSTRFVYKTAAVKVEDEEA